MSRQSLVLLSSVPPVVTYIGDPIRVDMWYSNGQMMHTVAIVASNFKGRLTIQATIKTNPGDSDWFPILLNDQPYIDYPRYPTNNFCDGETSTISFNFGGRFIWMRAIVDRSQIIAGDARPTVITPLGFIDRILINI